MRAILTFAEYFPNHRDFAQAQKQAARILSLEVVEIVLLVED
jgi:hypothetical protein